MEILSKQDMWKKDYVLKIISVVVLNFKGPKKELKKPQIVF
jgi:hypothetical protein